MTQKKFKRYMTQKKSQVIIFTIYSKKKKNSPTAHRIMRGTKLLTDLEVT